MGSARFTKRIRPSFEFDRDRTILDRLETQGFDGANQLAQILVLSPFTKDRELLHDFGRIGSLFQVELGADAKKFRVQKCPYPADAKPRFFLEGARIAHAMFRYGSRQKQHPEIVNYIIGNRLSDRILGFDLTHTVRISPEQHAIALERVYTLADAAFEQHPKLQEMASHLETDAGRVAGQRILGFTVASVHYDQGIRALYR